MKEINHQMVEFTVIRKRKEHCNHNIQKDIRIFIA